MQQINHHQGLLVCRANGHEFLESFGCGELLLGFAAVLVLHRNVFRLVQVQSSDFGWVFGQCGRKE